MKLYSLLNENYVLIGETVTAMDEALKKLLAAFGDLLAGHNPDQLVAAMLERERTFPTLIGEQVCLPHLRLEHFERFLVGILIPENPIPHASDGHPAISMLVIVIAPQNKNTMMLQTIAAVARL